MQIFKPHVLQWIRLRSVQRRPLFVGGRLKVEYRISDTLFGN